MCGWSGETDAALRSAVLRASNRRYATFWCRRSPLTGDAAALAAARDAVEVPIIDADRFFEELQMKVSLIAEGRAAPPVSTALALAELKRYLPDPVHRIRLDDFMRAEAEQAATAVGTEVFPTPAGEVTKEEVEARLDRYEAQMERLVSLLVAGVYHGDPMYHDDLWVRSVVVVERRPKSVGGRLWAPLQGYATTLNIFALGLAGIASGHTSALMKALLTQVPIEGGVSQEMILDRACPPRGFGDQAQQIIGNLGQQRKLTPVSDRVHAAMKPLTRQIFMSDDEYDRAFDTLEYMLAVMGSTGYSMYLGRFWHRHFSWGRPGAWPSLPSLDTYRTTLMDTGLFESDEALSEAIGRVNEYARMAPRT